MIFHKLYFDNFHCCLQFVQGCCCCVVVVVVVVVFVDVVFRNAMFESTEISRASLPIPHRQRINEIVG